MMAIALGGCVAAGSPRSTRDIYEAAVERSGYFFRCSARDGIRFDERLRPLLPWLEAELGKEYVSGVLSGMAENLSTTDFVSCPARRDRRRARVGVDRLLKQLETRSKR
jgi:hypothetical protein